jgi:hypothetical protein
MRHLMVAVMAFFMLAVPGGHAEVKAELESVIPGVEGPLFNFLDGKILITIKLLNAEIGGGGSFVIPKTKDSRFELAPNIIDGGTLVQLTLDPADIKGVRVGSDPHTLPDGRPIPGVPNGELPSLRIDTDWMNTSYYFAKTLFGVYLPVKFNTAGAGGSMSFKIGKKAGGTLFLVGSDAQGKNAAFLLFLQKSAMTAMEKHIEASLRNPGVLY